MQQSLHGEEPRPSGRTGRTKGTSRRRGRGQAVVEFALILPIFLVMTLGIVDMARIFTYYIALTNGVANASLFAGQGGYGRWCSGGVADIACPPGAPPPVANPNNIAYQIQVDAIGLTLADIDMSAPQCIPTAGPAVPVDCALGGTYSSVTIGATYNVSLLTPLMTALIGPIQMSAETTAAVQ